MKGEDIMKKVIRIIAIPIIIILVIIIYISYLTNHNQDYLDSITKNIQNNYQIDEEITYSNKYSNYYIFTTKSRVIVLNNDYQEILNESIATIKNKEEDQELIYKTSKLMFEEVEQKDGNLIYKYYDASTGEFLKETTMELK